MNNFTARVFRLMATGLGIAAGLWAQEAPPPDPAAPAVPAPVVFTVMAWDNIDPDRDLTLNYPSKGKLQTAEILWRDRSPALACDGPGPLVFSQTVTRDGKRVEVPVVTAVIPEGVTRALIVFGRNTAPKPGESGLRVMVIDDSFTRFPGQSVRLVNFSTKELGGALGARDFTVSPGKDLVVPAELPEENRLLPFRLARRAGAGGWQKLRSTGLPMTARLRVLVFLIDDAARPERVEMVLIRDTAPAPEEPMPEKKETTP